MPGQKVVFNTTDLPRSHNGSVVFWNGFERAMETFKQAAGEAAPGPPPEMKSSWHSPLQAHPGFIIWISLSTPKTNSITSANWPESRCRAHRPPGSSYGII